MLKTLPGWDERQFSGDLGNGWHRFEGTAARDCDDGYSPFWNTCSDLDIRAAEDAERAVLHGVVREVVGDI